MDTLVQQRMAGTQSYDSSSRVSSDNLYGLECTKAGTRPNFGNLVNGGNHALYEWPLVPQSNGDERHSAISDQWSDNGASVGGLSNRFGRLSWHMDVAYARPNYGSTLVHKMGILVGVVCSNVLAPVVLVCQACARCHESIVEEE